MYMCTYRNYLELEDHTNTGSWESTTSPGPQLFTKNQPLTFDTGGWNHETIVYHSKHGMLLSLVYPPKYFHLNHETTRPNKNRDSSNTHQGGHERPIRDPKIWVHCLDGWSPSAVSANQPQWMKQRGAEAPTICCMKSASNNAAKSSLVWSLILEVSHAAPCNWLRPGYERPVKSYAQRLAI